MKGLYEKIWTKQEDNMLLTYIETYGRDWDKISKTMRVKSKQLLEDRYKTLINQKQKPVWTLDEDILLLQMVDKLGKDWEMVQKVVKTKDIPSCKRRFAKIRDSCLSLDQDDKDLIVLNQFWYKEDEEMLLFLYELYGGNWGEIYKRMPERYSKHIQEQFKSKGLANQLHKWNQEKDARLMTYALYGIPFSQFEQETGFSILQCEERLKKIIFKISKQLQQPRKTKEQKQFDEIMQFNYKNNNNKKCTKGQLKIQAQENEKQQYFSQFEAALNQSHQSKYVKLSNVPSRVAQKQEMDDSYDEDDDDIGIVLDEDIASD